MRLKSLWVSDYKNLKDFSVEFDGDSFIDILVGKNGSGKSNLFEALIEIFKHLYEYDDYTSFITFKYELQYKIDDSEVLISHSDGKLKIQGEERASVPIGMLPENVLVYYSGHNKTVFNLLENYEAVFRKRIKGASLGDSRRFIGIGPEYKELLLTMLIIEHADMNSKDFIYKKLGISLAKDELKLVLTRPHYASTSKFDIESSEKDRYWKAEGITKDFLDRLGECNSTVDGQKIRTEGYIGNEDKYVLYYDLGKIRDEFTELTPLELFTQFDNLKTLGMLGSISIPLVLEDGNTIPVSHFSDGQFQSVYMFAVMKLYQDCNCLTLLDEPDSFLHPEWQHDFLTQISEIPETEAVNNHILMTSHSAVTLIPYNQRKIKYLRYVKGSLCCHDVNKKFAVNQLSSNIINYTEDQQILSIMHSVNIDDLPVFFTEGSTDPVILKTAWEKLYEIPMPFIPIFAFSCTYLRRLLLDERICNELGHKPMFGLFDFDEAYNEWHSLKEKGHIAVSDPYEGMRIDIESKNSYAFLLPVPTVDEIEMLVIKDKSTKETFLHQSRLTIEHLFYGDDATHSFFETETTVSGPLLVFKESSKTSFARNIVPAIDKSHFEVFRPMFEFIKSKCTSVTT